MRIAAERTKPLDMYLIFLNSVLSFIQSPYNGVMCINKPSFFSLLLIATSCGLLAQGRQLTGPHAPSTSPALSPAEAVKSFKVPDGFEVRLFAAEPMVINPVAMTWDNRGRLWVVELFEYPLGAAPGTKPRDKIKILEDVDGDGRADKVTLFADGLNLATGILLGYGGAFVGQAPHLLFLEDTNGDDVADAKTVFLDGFGMEDRHELLNGFTWGPDGWLYMTHGVFTHSKVRDPNDPEDDGVIMNAAVARVNPVTKAFEVFADGTSNPWGVDFDARGNAFVSACVIDHLFHMTPGGLYARQAGSPEFKHAYQLLPSIVDHRHYRAAYAGIQIYQGNQYPDAYTGRVFMGNIHANAVVQDSLESRGSGFKASAEDDFMVSNDGWFRPVSEQVGPDGALWVMDWYDKYPCYQNARADPEGVDREYGRIWRVVYTGDKPGTPVAAHEPGLDLGKLNGRDLALLLKHPNIWHRKTAQRILSERKNPAVAPVLAHIIANEAQTEIRLSALWTLHSSGQLTHDHLNEWVDDTDPAIRTWVARFTGEMGDPSEAALRRLYRLSTDPDPSVRLAVATACRQMVSGSLTINTPGPVSDSPGRVGPVLASLIQHSRDGEDPVIPFLIWMVMEPLVVEGSSEILQWFGENGGESWPLSGDLTYKLFRRLGDTRDMNLIGPGIDWIVSMTANDTRLVDRALAGLLDTPGIGQIKPDAWSLQRLNGLLNHILPSIRNQSRYLGAMWQNQNAINGLIGALKEPEVEVGSKIQLIEQAGAVGGDLIGKALLDMLKTVNHQGALQAVIQSVNRTGIQGGGDIMIQRWNDLGPSARQSAIQALVSRTEWLRPFLDAIEKREIDPAVIPASVIRQLTDHRDSALRERSRLAIGRFRPPNADIERLITEKKRMILEGEPDIEAGRKVAEAACLNCHKLHGKGAEVGPDLTGVGRSTMDALLANVINPNQIIGTGYENVEVEFKDDQSISGRLMEETDSYVKILSAGPVEHVITKDNIASKKVSELSVMPEGLEQIPDDDFRNLIWFILNPPEDERAMTDALRAELIGPVPAQPTRDYESIALWNPEWSVRSAERDIAPSKLHEHLGRKNVLVTYPFWHQGAATLEREFKVPETGTSLLKVHVAAKTDGRWVLRVFADHKMVLQEPITTSDGWREISIDLTPFAGRHIPLKLENYAFNMDQDFAFWSDLRIEHQP